MIQKATVLITALVLLSGCFVHTTIQHRDFNATYTRAGEQDLNGLQISAGDVNATLESQKAKGINTNQLQLIMELLSGGI